MIGRNPLPSAPLTKSGDGGDLEALVADALRRAAVVGTFQPNDVLGEIDADLARRARSALSRVCDVKADETVFEWRLKDAERKRVLESLRADQGEFRETLTETEPFAGDAESRLLRKFLDPDAAAPTDPATLGEADLKILFRLVNGGYLPQPAPDPRAVRQEISRRAVASALADETKNFVGREDSLFAVRDFAVRTPVNLVPVLILSGLGGVGKSSLLARVREGLNKIPPDLRPLLVHIDFDRPGFGPRDVLNLTMEMTRQLALQRSDLADEFAGIRALVGEYFLGGDAFIDDITKSIATEHVHRARQEMMYRLSDLVAAQNLGEHPVILLFDAFEAAQAVSDYAVRMLADWVTQLHRTCGLHGLRVIVSGRNPLESWPAAERDIVFGRVDQIRLEDFDGPDARAYLEKLGWPGDQAKRIVQSFGGNPLVLRLVSRLLNSPDGPDLDTLLSDKRFDAQAQMNRTGLLGALYDSILDHIPDPRTRALARAGLALRRISAPTLRHVLAPAGLGEDIADDEAQLLFDALKKESWLLTPSEDGNTLTHDRAIRRVMLPLIAADPDSAAAFTKLHLKAVAFYENAGPEESAASDEALYHRMMVADGSHVPYLGSGIAAAVEAALGAEADDLPVLPRARLKSALGQPLTMEEADCLDDEGWWRFVGKQGQELVASGLFNRALDLVRHRPRRVSEPLPLWHMRALDSALSWQELAESPRPGEAVSHRAERASLLALANLRLGRYAAAFDIADETVRLASRSGVRVKDMPATVRCASYAQLALRGALAAGGMVGGPPARLDLQFTTADILASPPLRHELLRWGLIEGSTLGGRVPPAVILFCPSLQWLSEVVSAAPGALKDRLTAFGADLDADLSKPPGPSSSALLGGISQAVEVIFTEAFVKGETVDAPLRALLVRADNAEYRAPLTTALMDDFGTLAGLQMLAEIGAGQFAITPFDLSPERFARDSEMVARGAISRFVAYADRARVLPEIVRKAREAKPGGERLALVGDALEEWVALHRS